jgi:hypothetical protein
MLRGGSLLLRISLHLRAVIVPSWRPARATEPSAVALLARQGQCVFLRGCYRAIAAADGVGLAPIGRHHGAALVSHHQTAAHRVRNIVMPTRGMRHTLAAGSDDAALQLGQLLDHRRQQVSFVGDGFLIRFAPAWGPDLIKVLCEPQSSSAVCEPTSAQFALWENPGIEMHVNPILHVDGISFEATSVQLTGKVRHQFAKQECKYGAPCEVLTHILAKASNPNDEGNIAHSLLKSFNGSDVPHRGGDFGIKSVLELWFVGPLRELTEDRLRYPISAVQLENGKLVIEQ